MNIYLNFEGEKTLVGKVTASVGDEVYSYPIYHVSDNTSLATVVSKHPYLKDGIYVGNRFMSYHDKGKDLEPVIVHELAHLIYNTDNEFKADLFVLGVLGHKGMEDLIEILKQSLADVRYASTRLALESLFNYRLNATKELEDDCLYTAVDIVTEFIDYKGDK